MAQNTKYSMTTNSNHVDCFLLELCYNHSSSSNFEKRRKFVNRKNFLIFSRVF